MSRLPDRIRRTLRARAVGGSSPSAPAPSPENTATGDSGPMPGGLHLPAGEDPADDRPTALRRGRLRSRLRHLERRRELMLRDLGGLVFELHRSGEGGDREHQRSLVSAKVARIAEADAELAAGRAVLGRRRGDLLLREPGLGGLCPNCGEVHDSDARFCPACGMGVAGSTGERAVDHGAGESLTDPVLPYRASDQEGDVASSPGSDAPHGSENPTRVLPSRPVTAGATAAGAGGARETTGHPDAGGVQQAAGDTGAGARADDDGDGDGDGDGEQPTGSRPTPEQRTG